MSPNLQTVLALAVVAAVIGAFAYRAFRRRSRAGCGSEGCSAVSGDVRKLQAHLRRTEKP